MAQGQLDVLSVGDVVIDDFIRLLDKEEKVEHKKDGAEWLAIPFGTKIPFDHSEAIPAVGNASNASVAFARLGLKSGLVANIGNDTRGRDILARLEKEKVDTRFVHINPGKKSNYHYVLWYKDERTILIKHEEYDYHWPRFRIIDIPKWIYFSSVSEHALEYHDQIAAWLESHPSVKMAFQPGTFQIEAGTKRLKDIYKHSELLAVNREEATTISGGSHADIHDLFDKLHALGPKIVVISDGHAGAYASDGQTRYKMPIYPDPRPPYDRTGAGDAFTSTFVAAIMKGADIQGALLWAPINSMSVVQKVAAQAGLLSERDLESYLRKAPKWYHPERVR
ncbi:MAG TPA: carbohydrate kinase family protein [Candidatus Saccharimonadales bacterium]|nr:carbohydrate kinase family protein [Candidatus Saccharimonadales bacterium]